MDIKAAKADLKKRQQAVVEVLNRNAAQQQQLAIERQELVKEAERLNGESRMLKRLNGDKPKKDG